MEIRSVNKSFKAPVLSDLSASFNRGFHIITGANGCGKTTLLRLISGRLIADSGEISPGPEKVSSVFNSASFYPQLTAAQNLEFFLALRGKKFSREEILKACLFAGLPEAELDKKVENLSSGNLVKAGLSKMYLEDGEVFLIDEVLSSLDSESFEKNLSLLVEKSLEKTVLLVSHQKERFLQNTSSLWEIREGRIYPL